MDDNWRRLVVRKCVRGRACPNKNLVCDLLWSEDGNFHIKRSKVLRCYEKDSDSILLVPAMELLKAA
jgi:hypothetical protein